MHTGETRSWRPNGQQLAMTTTATRRSAGMLRSICHLHLSTLTANTIEFSISPWTARTGRVHFSINTSHSCTDSTQPRPEQDQPIYHLSAHRGTDIAALAPAHAYVLPSRGQEVSFGASTSSASQRRGGTRPYKAQGLRAWAFNSAAEWWRDGCQCCSHKASNKRTQEEKCREAQGCGGCCV